MKRHAWVLVVLLVVLIGTGVSASYFTAAKYAVKAPKIDGILNDEIWKKIEPVSDFVTPSGGASELKTEFWVAWDRDFLYVAIKNYGDTSRLQKNITEDGGPTWDDDENSVFLNPDYPTMISMYQYSFNTIAVRTGLAYGGTVAPEYDLWEVAIHEEDDYYTAEIAISFESTFSWPEVGDEWGFNIGRGCTSTGNTYSWSFLPSGTFIDATSFGVLEFIK